MSHTSIRKQDLQTVLIEIWLSNHAAIQFVFLKQTLSDEFDHFLFVVHPKTTSIDGLVLAHLHHLATAAKIDDEVVVFIVVDEPSDLALVDFYIALDLVESLPCVAVELYVQDLLHTDLVEVLELSLPLIYLDLLEQLLVLLHKCSTPAVLLGIFCLHNVKLHLRVLSVVLRQ